MTPCFLASTTPHAAPHPSRSCTKPRSEPMTFSRFTTRQPAKTLPPTPSAQQPSADSTTHSEPSSSSTAFPPSPACPKYSADRAGHHSHQSSRTRTGAHPTTRAPSARPQPPPLDLKIRDQARRISRARNGQKAVAAYKTWMRSNAGREPLQYRQKARATEIAESRTFLANTRNTSSLLHRIRSTDGRHLGLKRVSLFPFLCRLRRTERRRIDYIFRVEFRGR